MALFNDKKHSKNFDKVNNYYNSEPRLWKISRVREAVVKGWITEDEFKEITGEEY